MQNVEIEEQSPEIPCLIVPMMNRPLLVPNASVAEVITYAKIRKLSDAPPWCLGIVEWRHIFLSLVSIEGLNGFPVIEPDLRSRILILNGISGDPRLPFYAVMVHGIARSVRIKETDITYENTDTGFIDLMNVNVLGDRLVVPDLDRIEQEIIAYQSAAAS
jgi:chemosensory pili system protein ChpC